MNFKFYFQEEYLDWGKLKQTTGAEEYRSARNVNHGVIEDKFMNLASATAANDSACMELTMTNENFKTQLRQHEDQIKSEKLDICYLKVLVAT